MDGRIEKMMKAIRERMTGLYSEYTSERDDNPDKEDYYDGLLDAWHEIDDMLDEVLEVEE